MLRRHLKGLMNLLLVSFIFFPAAGRLRAQEDLFAHIEAAVSEAERKKIQAYWDAASIYLEKNDFRKVAEYLEKTRDREAVRQAAILYAELIEDHYNAGRCFVRVNEPYLAAREFLLVEEYYRAGRLYREAECWREAAHCYEYMGENELAAKYFIMAGRYHDAARMYRSEGDNKKALKYYVLAAKDAAEHGDYYEAASAYEEFGDYINAKKYYERGISESDSAKAALCYEKLGLEGEAKRKYMHLLLWAVSNEKYGYIAELYHRLGREKECERFLQKAINKNAILPKRQKDYTIIAQVYELKKEYSRAVEYYERQMHANPDPALLIKLRELRKKFM